MKQLTIERNRGYYGIIRKLDIVVDGQTVATLKKGASTTIDVPDEAHELWGQMDWAKTDTLDLQGVRSGQTVRFEAYFTFNLLRGIGAQRMPFRIVVTG